ncbi:outer membrane beta-barrel protein [Flavobacterium sp.]|uniref:outer membrane beta-barrel protein n=1 Tax=Flavobacterium sp. TaxID=239 RepID=UPI00286D9C7A|nr:outer membrane beta-barrel protein [Flavobacterium sp.]
MENNKDIGKIFREKIDQLEKSPSNDLWSNIEKDLDSKKERKIPFLWYSTAFLILGLIAGGIFLNNNQFKDYDKTNQEVILKNNAITNNKKNNQENNANSIEKNNLAKDSRTQKNIEIENSSTIKNKDQVAPNNIQLKNSYLVKNDSKVFVQKNKSTNTVYLKNKNNIQNSTKSIVSSDNNSNKKTKKNKATYYYETTKLVNTSKRLVKSSAEYTEYEIVKKYTYIIKKKNKVATPMDKNLSLKKKKVATSLNKNSSLKKKKDANSLNKNKISNKKNASKSKKTNLKKKANIKKSKRPFTKTAQLDDNSTASDKLSGSNNETTFVQETKIDSIITPLTEQKTKKITKKEIKKEKTKDSLVKKEKKLNIYLTPYIGPSYSNSFNNKNSLSDRYNVTSKNESININFGFYVRAMITKKLGIRAGFGVINSKNSTTILKQDASFLDFRNIDYQIEKTESDFNNLFLNDSEITFSQKISYTEIPLEAYYIWKDGKFGFATGAGMSFLFLGNNTLNIKSKSVEELRIGKAKNLNENCYTANLNFTFSYKISDKINLELSPNLKYQLKGFNRANEYQPYIFVLQSGISYKY